MRHTFTYFKPQESLLPLDAEAYRQQVAIYR